MKNQYFGDTRDLFKYDLVLEIMKRIKSLQKFAFVPMLTPNDDRNDGNERNLNTARAGHKNNYLINFLEPFHNISKEKRDFRKIEIYYKKLNIRIEIYNHQNNDEYFTSIGRNKYFDGIKRKFLQEALICIDPDNGLQIKKNTEKHILYNELKDVYNKISNTNSIIMVFQFFPRVKHPEYIRQRLSELSAITSNFGYISDNKIVFFFLTKNGRLMRTLEEVLKKYIDDYSSCYCG